MEACLCPPTAAPASVDLQARAVSVPAPKFQVNLDLPPRERWKHVINRYLPEFDRMRAFIVKTEVDEFGTVGPWFAALIKASFATGWRLIMTPELSEEIEGIAEITAKHGLDYRTLLVLNIGYDLVARCTSIVAPTADGMPCLLRNMDWESPVLHSTTIDVEFLAGGKGTTWVGFVGLLTGMRPLDAQGNGYLKPLWGAACRRWPAAALIRDVLKSCGSYQEARTAFSIQHTMAPCYLTLAGTKPGEGCIITRSTRGIDKLLELPRQSGAIVQTNIDYDIEKVDVNWAAGDPLLLNAITRRQKAQEKLRLPCDPTDNATWEVLETIPVLNELTIYSCIICPQRGIYKTKLQFPEGTPATHHTGRIHRIIDFVELASA